jgi:hypothetical protein
MFTVLMYGGIGDTLRNLSVFPHQYIYDKWRIRTKTFYKHWKLTGEHQYASPPGTEFFHAMTDRFPSLCWGGETTSHHGMPAICNRLVREVIKLANKGEPFFFELRPTLSLSESAALPKWENKPVIGIQTHLLGTKTKEWGIPNWRLFLQMLLQQYPSAQLVLIEPSDAVADLIVAPNITTTTHLNLYQLIHLFKSFDLVVSVDSWAKYVAAWNKTPQVIVVPDQRSQYPSLTADELLGLQFFGIFGKERNRTIGLERTASGRGLLTLDKMAELSPENLLRETMEKLQILPVCARPSNP